ncbi:DNA-binding response regulator [bacterium D16-34]|nr:DNA-binding response regulator [bacterium D16-34]
MDQTPTDAAVGDARDGSAGDARGAAASDASDATVGDASGATDIRILIADDQDIVRSGFRLVLMSYEGIEVVGEARDGKEAVALAARLRPDVVLMDIRMPHENGIEATREIRQNPDLDAVHVLILTTFDHDEYVYEALAAGASGFLLKDADPDEIVAAVRVVAAGDALIEPSITRRLIEQFVASRPHTSFSYRRGEGLDSLTDREREILRLVARGLSNDEIGAELFISPATVKTHIARIMAKVDAHDRAQLVIRAYESGLVKTGGR